MTDTQAIKDRLDIVQVIGEYVQLKKLALTGKPTALFHNEKSPSFMVQSEKQFWHCFGCGKGRRCFSPFCRKWKGWIFPKR